MAEFTLKYSGEEIDEAIGLMRSLLIWSPHPDWWDIETIVNTGIVPWRIAPLTNVRYGFVVSDSNNTIRLPAGYEYYLSDGGYYNSGAIIFHTWDTEQDKDCSDGYKTRCVIVCSSDRSISISQRAFAYDGIDSLYVFLGDCHVSTMVFSGSGTASYSNKLIQAVHCTDNTTSGTTSIYTYAFYNCYGLRSMMVPDGLTTFGASVFRGSGLVSINIPDSLTGLGTYTFYACHQLRNITIPDGVASIGNYTFYACYSLTNIKIPDSVKTIGTQAFYGCYGLMNIDIPNMVTTIGDSAFYNCYSLKGVTISANVTNIGTTVFGNCHGLKNVTIPLNFAYSLTLDGTNSLSLSVSSIDEMAHNYNGGLTTLTLTIGATNIAKLSEDTLEIFEMKNITLA